VLFQGSHGFILRLNLQLLQSLGVLTDLFVFVIDLLLEDAGDVDHVFFVLLYILSGSFRVVFQLLVTVTSFLQAYLVLRDLDGLCLLFLLDK